MKIDITLILKDHIKTIVNANTNKLSVEDILIFIGVPILFAVLCANLKVILTNDLIDIIVSSLSIFVGLLFNIIVVLFDIVKTEKVRIAKIVLVREVVSNISFAIVLSITTIFSSLSTLLELGEWFKKTMNFITFSFICLFLLTLLMILKRMYYLFVEEMQNIEKQHENGKM